ncbi:MAG: hypothetical protein Q7S00_02095, partial [bacterium]|nr:hypothetical protein [bacterium]
YFGFHIDDSLGVVNLSREEQRIGEAARDLPKELPLYAHSHLFWETIEYYSHGKKVDGLPEQKLQPERFLLVLPTSLSGALSEITEKPMRVLYRGPMLSLLATP